jgi:MFS superfamily sulfate permease-like transporter
MSTALQTVASVSPELVIVFGIAGVLLLANVVLSVWIYRDASSRNDDHAFAWGAATFFSGFVGGIGIVVVIVLYFVVRDESGSGAPSVRDSV